MIAFILLVIAIFIFFAVRFMLKRKKKEQEIIDSIPEKVLEDFNEAERRYDIESKKKIVKYLSGIPE